MKNILVNLTIVFCFLLFHVSMQGQVIFFNSFDQARLKAKELKKATFIKVCVSDNRKCRKLDEEVFADQEISDILNLNFINVRIDPNIESSFVEVMNIKSVPTLIFISKEGEEIDRLTGGKDASETIKVIKSNARKVSGINTMRKSYLSNKKDNVLLKEYYKLLTDSGFSGDARRLVPQFFYNTKSPQTREDLDFVLNSADHHRSQSFKYILENLNQFDTAYSIVTISDQLMNAFLNSLNEDVADDITYVDRRMKSVFRGIDYQRFYDAYILQLYESVETDKEGLNLYCQSGARRLVRLNCTDPEYANTLRVSLMLKNQENTFLKSLMGEVQYCYDSTGDIPTLDLLSVLNYKLGEKDKAIKMVQEATKLAFDKKMKFVSSLRYFKEAGFIE